jgi:hypothetical protein
MCFPRVFEMADTVECRVGIDIWLQLPLLKSDLTRPDMPKITSIDNMESKDADL